MREQSSLKKSYTSPQPSRRATRSLDVSPAPPDRMFCLVIAPRTLCRKSSRTYVSAFDFTFMVRICCWTSSRTCRLGRQSVYGSVDMDSRRSSVNVCIIAAASLSRSLSYAALRACACTAWNKFDDVPILVSSNVTPYRSPRSARPAAYVACTSTPVASPACIPRYCPPPSILRMNCVSYVNPGTVISIVIGTSTSVEGSIYCSVPTPVPELEPAPEPEPGARSDAISACKKVNEGFRW